MACAAAAEAAEGPTPRGTDDIADDDDDDVLQGEDGELSSSDVVGARDGSGDDDIALTRLTHCYQSINERIFSHELILGNVPPSQFLPGSS